MKYQILPKFELVQDFIDTLITSKFDDEVCIIHIEVIEGTLFFLCSMA